MSVCWKPGWCECQDCGRLTQVVGGPNTCEHTVVRLEIPSTERTEPWRSSYCDRCGLVNPRTAASVDPRLEHLLEVEE